ncbi:MAG: 30S ribosomal protein S8 [SAR202 cluster bacterium]|nr:30S ribosomal protein S8 [SAR202 cluster bacterium]
MSVTDPIADMLTRIRNALMARHDSVIVPTSKTKEAIARLLKDEQYISSYELLRTATPQRAIRIQLSYKEDGAPSIEGLKRISKPGLRVYVQHGEIPRVFGGLGIAIISTSQGIMTGTQAWRNKTGGELLCYVW